MLEQAIPLKPGLQWQFPPKSHSPWPLQLLGQGLGVGREKAAMAW
jgi:hypothetical protein